MRRCAVQRCFRVVDSALARLLLLLAFPRTEPKATPRTYGAHVTKPPGGARLTDPRTDYLTLHPDYPLFAFYQTN